jgi:hypothetical protein
MIKFIFSIGFLCFALQVVAQHETIDTNFHLYLLIGQSNMAGRGAPDAESKKVNERILMLDSQNRWVPATDPVHFDKPNAVGVGPAIGFANGMLEKNSKIKIGLIPCAIGGSPIKVWEPRAVYLNKFHPYDDAVSRAQAGMKRGVLKGILWHQGESDNDSSRAPLYLQKLGALINRLRTDLKQPAVPFVAGEIGYFIKADHINKVIRQLPMQVSNTAVVSAKGLTDKGDQLHFDSPSARELGKRYAAAMQQLQMYKQATATLETNEKVLKLLAEEKGPVVDASHPDVLATSNRSGFETGQVVKLNNVYHMFVNEMFDRPHRDLRIAYWTSMDAVKWKRQSTIVNSIPGRTATNPRSEVWVNAVVFNDEENAWNIFYTAYRAGDSTKGEIAGNDYEGRIWRAKSVMPGRDGIAGPYADMGIVLQPDSSSQAWEGQQAVASFFPYKAGNTWYAIYDGHFHTPKGPWPDGMAFAQKLNGPWTRMPEGFNPLTIVKEFGENA